MAMGSMFEQVTDVAGYHLAERIGAGGMGEVYKAYNSSLNRFAAVKILYEASYTDRFKNEAYIQSSVSHPNIAMLYDYAICRDKHCIVMEYVDGESLDYLLQQKRRFSSGETENIVRQVVAALVYLHKKDIMHRDIKPQNFKIQPDGTVKMLDFGIAKHKYSPKFTKLGFIVGTTEYLAPEQLLQQPELKSDIWALSVMTYELVTGYMPFEASSPVVLQSKIKKGAFTDPAILIPDVSEKLALIIDKGLNVHPASRISAAGISAILGTNDAGEEKPAAGLRFLNKKLLLQAAVAAIILLLLILLILNNDETKPGPSAPVTPTEQPVPPQQKMLPEPVAGTNKMIINVPGITNGEIILSDGSRKPLPYTLTGKEGELFNFTLHAEGYIDKQIQVVLTPRRISYEFNLDKNNN